MDDKQVKGQATLELSVALIVVMLLLVATARLFVWLNDGMVNRQVQYENTRVSVAGPTTHETISLAPLDNVTKNDLQLSPTEGVINATFNEVNLFI